MNIILLGAPGSGKGTQSEFLTDKKEFTQLSTGDLFRKNISESTELGLEAQKYMNEGKYVPDSITNGMVKEYLNSRNDGLIFDGYPRTLDQANELDKMLAELSKQIDKAVYINVNEDVLLDRLSGRMICPKCKRSYHVVNRKPAVDGKCDFDQTELVVRPDDQPDKIKTRLVEYNTLTQPLIDFYKKAGKLVEVVTDGLKPSEVFEKICLELGI